MILVVTVSQLKTSVPCDRIMQENEDMECVVAVNKREKKQQQQKEHKKILVTGFHNHILIKKQQQRIRK